MIISIFTIIALVSVIIASYTDIKTLEVPDWLSYTMIAAGIFGNLFYTLYHSDPLFIIRSLLGIGLAAIIGLLMFYTGQWGGGDSKVLFGLGALLGIDYPFSVGFFMKFLINMLFAGAIYGVIWLAVMAIKNRKPISKSLKKELGNKKYYRLRMISAIIAIAGLALINFLPYFDTELKIMMSVLIAIFYSMNYMIILVRLVEKAAMIQLVPPEKLTEGDWIVDEIKIEGKYITGPKDLGITKPKIEELIRLKNLGKIKNIKVKYGIPFVPSFLIALVYTMITNSIFLIASLY